MASVHQAALLFFVLVSLVLEMAVHGTFLGLDYTYYPEARVMGVLAFIAVTAVIGTGVWKRQHFSLGELLSGTWRPLLVAALILAGLMSNAGVGGAVAADRVLAGHGSVATFHFRENATGIMPGLKGFR